MLLHTQSERSQWEAQEHTQFKKNQPLIGRVQTQIRVLIISRSMDPRHEDIAKCIATLVLIEPIPEKDHYTETQVDEIARSIIKARALELKKDCAEFLGGNHLFALVRKCWMTKRDICDLESINSFIKLADAL